MGIIMTGFAGIGKTTLGAKYKNVIDLESSEYQYISTDGSLCYTEENKAGPRRRLNRMFPMNYLMAVGKALQEYDIVLVCCGAQVLDSLRRLDVDVLCFYPDQSCKDEYVQRSIDRGNNRTFINIMQQLFNSGFNHICEYGYPVYTLKAGETLESKLFELGYIEEDGNLVKGDNVMVKLEIGKLFGELSGLVSCIDSGILPTKNNARNGYSKTHLLELLPEIQDNLDGDALELGILLGKAKALANNITDNIEENKYARARIKVVLTEIETISNSSVKV